MTSDLSSIRLLIVDDEPDMLDACREILAPQAETIVTETEPARALARIEAETFDLLLTDVRMPEMSGVELLRRARAHQPDLAVLLLTAFPDSEAVEASVVDGASGFVTKPFAPAQLRAAVTRALLDRRARGHATTAAAAEVCGEFFGTSDESRVLFETVERAARTNVDVLFDGESGCGKHLLAQALHRRSARDDAPWAAIQCAGRGMEELRTALFGLPGDGAVRQARNGSLFLGNAGCLSAELQDRLVRELESSGDDRPRLLVTTEQDPEGGFLRPNLLYLVRAVRIRVAPLRRRRAELWDLVQHLVARESRRMKRSVHWITPELRAPLERYGWPGNVRELVSVVRAMLSAAPGDRLELEHLPAELLQAAASSTATGDDFFAARDEVVRSFEARFLRDTLRAAGGDVSAAAKAAAVPRGTFYRLLGKYHIRPADYRPRSSHD